MICIKYQVKLQPQIQPVQNKHQDSSFGPGTRTQTDEASSLPVSPLLHVKVSSKAAATAEQLPAAQGVLPPSPPPEGQWLSYLQAPTEAELKSARFNFSSLV